MEPADVVALNQLASVLEQFGDSDGAISHSERVLLLEPGSAIARSRLHRLGALPSHRPPPGPPGSGVWTWDEAFPYVDTILCRMTAETDGWVRWRDVRNTLSTDPAAAVVMEHWAGQAKTSVGRLASEIMAAWNASITIGSDRNPWRDDYERRPDMNAYRRRRRRPGTQPGRP